MNREVFQEPGAPTIYVGPFLQDAQVKHNWLVRKFMVSNEDAIAFIEIVGVLQASDVALPTVLVGTAG